MIIRASDVELQASINAADNPGMVPYFGGAVVRAQGCAEDPNAVDREGSDIIPIRNIQKLLKKAEFDVATEVTVEGTFFRAMLLCTGWWAGENGTKLAEQMDWQGDHLKQWLFHGFEAWGPSCDMHSGQQQNEPYLFGQIGDRDEADSLLLIVAQPKADEMHAKLATSAGAFNVRARGFLRHPRHIPEIELRRRIEAWGDTFNYCLYVSASEAEHFAHPITDQPTELYSGYLWQCWLPQRLAKYSDKTQDGVDVLTAPRLGDVYFLWEHTNFAKQSALNYNLDSLRHKTEYLRHEQGNLILVQKSSQLVEGEQALSQEDFYRFIVKSRTGR
jgi:hypothetical protein